MNGGKANKSGVWTADEDKLLAEWQSQLGNKWAEVARQIPGKTGQQCAQRWRHRVNPDIRREKWGADEDAALAALVQKHGNSWAVIARSMPGRTDQQCMGRWKRHLDPSIRRESWTPQEDALLFQLAEEYENAWSAVSRGLTGRTPQQCRTRWHYISGNPNAAEASRAAIQAMRDAQAAADAAKAGLKKRRGRPSKNTLAAAAAGMLTALAPLPKGMVVQHAPRYDPSSGNGVVDSVAAPPRTVGAKRAAPARRPGRPPRKKIPAVDEDYLGPANIGTTGANGYSNHQYEAAYQNNTNAAHHGSIDGEEAMLLDGFWTSAGAPQPAGAGVAVTGRRNRPTRARIPSRRTSFAMMSEEEDGSEDDEEEYEEDEDFVVRGQQGQQQQKQIWRRQHYDNDRSLEAPPTAAAGVGNNDSGGGVPADSDFEGEDDTDNEAEFDREDEEDDEEYIPRGAAARRHNHGRRNADGHADNNGTGIGEREHEEEEGYVFGGIRTHPVNQQHPSTFDSSTKQVQQHMQSNQPSTTAAGGAAAAGVSNQHQQQQQYFEEPALLLGSSRAERRVSLGDVPLSPAVFSPALTPPWSRKKRQNHARLAAFGPSVPTTTTGAPHAPTTSNGGGPLPQHSTPLSTRRHHLPQSGTVAATLQAGAPLASPGILDLLHSPETFQRHSGGVGNGDEDGTDHNDTGNVGHHGHGNGDEDFFPGVFPESPALPQFAGLITPEWARAAAAASAAAENAEVRRLSIASVARRLDIDSVAFGVAHNNSNGGGVAAVGTGAGAGVSGAPQGSGDSPPQAGSLSVSLSLSAGGIPPTTRQTAAITPAVAAAIVAAPGLEHTFFSPVEPTTAGAGADPSSAPPAGGIAATPCFFPVVTAAGNHLVLTEPPPAMAHATAATTTTTDMLVAPSSAPPETSQYTTAIPSSESHGRSFLAAALQRVVGTGLMPPSGAFFPANTTLITTTSEGHIVGSSTGEVAALPAGSMLAATPMVETVTAAHTGDGGAPPAAASQIELIPLPARQYNRVMLQNTTLTARKDAAATTNLVMPVVATTATAPMATAAPLSSSDVRMKLQALLEQV